MCVIFVSFAERGWSIQEGCFNIWTMPTTFRELIQFYIKRRNLPAQVYAMYDSDLWERSQSASIKINK